MSAPSQAASQADGVRRLIEPLAEAVGLVVEDVTITPAGRRRVLRITVDLPETETGGVPMDAVAKASTAISAALDSDSTMGGTPYVLEVSSPGTDRPLTQRRHWLRARGRLVSLVPADGVATSQPPWAGSSKAADGGSGRLTEVDDDGVVLDGERRFGWEQMRLGRVELDFSRPLEVGDDENLEDIEDSDDLDDIEHFDGDDEEV